MYYHHYIHSNIHVIIIYRNKKLIKLLTSKNKKILKLHLLINCSVFVKRRGKLKFGLLL